MGHLILDHGVSGSFGTDLAPVEEENRRPIGLLINALTRMRDFYPSSSLPRLLPRPAAASPVSVIRFPTCLGGFFLQGSVNDSSEFLAVFLDVAVTLTHRSSFWELDVSCPLHRYAEMESFSAALWNERLPSCLLEKLVCEREHVLRNLLKNAVPIVARDYEPSRQAPRLGISDRPFLVSIPTHRNDRIIVPFSKGYAVVVWPAIMKDLNKGPALFGRMNLIWGDMLARHDKHPFVKLFKTVHIHSYIAVHMKLFKIFFKNMWRRSIGPSKSMGNPVHPLMIYQVCDWN